MNKRRRYLAKRRRAAWQAQRMLDARVARLGKQLASMLAAFRADEEALFQRGLGAAHMAEASMQRRLAHSVRAELLISERALHAPSAAAYAFLGATS